jgi:hypothetical protein
VNKPLTISPIEDGELLRKHLQMLHDYIWSLKEIKLDKSKAVIKLISNQSEKVKSGVTNTAGESDAQPESDLSIWKEDKDGKSF